jgi:hypothetical protein
MLLRASLERKRYGEVRRIARLLLTRCALIPIGINRGCALFGNSSPCGKLQLLRSFPQCQQLT